MPTWRNWSGYVRCHPGAIERPSSIEALSRLVRDVDRRGGNLRMVGSGHSFSPVVATHDTLVSLDEMQGIAEVDHDRELATLWAGTKIHSIGQPLLDEGLALINQGDVHEQAIAGALATGTHGTGLELGSLSTTIDGMTIVKANGEVIEADRETNREVWEMGRVALGTLGVMAKVRLQVRPAYKLREIKRNVPLDDCLDSIDENIRRYRHWEFFWFPYSENASTKALDEIEAEPTRVNRVRHLLVDVALENGAWFLLCEATRLRPGLSPRVSRLAGQMFSEGEKVDWSFKVFPAPRLVRFKEMEYAVPVEYGAAVLREVRDMIKRERMPVNFPIEFRFVKGDDIPLSPFYQRDSAVLSFHVYSGKPHRPYFDAAEEICRRYEGRPHWGKMHTLDAADFRSMYPRFDDFQRLRRELDPKGTFLSPYMRRVFEPASSPLRDRAAAQ